MITGDITMSTSANAHMMAGGGAQNQLRNVSSVRSGNFINVSNSVNLDPESGKDLLVHKQISNQEK